MSTVPTAPRRRLRLLFVANSVRRGGAETQLVRIALGCAERGHDVRIVTFLDREGWQPELAEAGIPLTHLPTSSASRAPVTVARAVALSRRFRPHALIGFDYQPSVAVRLIGAVARVPVVVSSIRNEELGGGRLREASVRLSNPLATVTTTNSARVASDLLARRLVSGARLAVLPNGMDVAALERPAGTRDRVRDDLGVPDDSFLWLSVSYLRREKDVGTLLSAVEIARDRSTAPFQVLIAGDGALLSALSEEAVARELTSHVRFLGRRTDIPDLLAAADAFVLSSRAEGLPNAVMEAMAAGLPVVATRVGGIPELVDDGRTGRLVPPGDPDALATAMAEVAGIGADSRAVMGGRGRATVEAGYGLAQLIDGWEELLVSRVEQAERTRTHRGTRTAPAGAA